MDLIKILKFLIPDAIGISGYRFLHSDEGDDLQQMVLHDVSDHSVAIEVSTSSLDTEVFFEVDLDRGDTILVPRGAKHPIGESETEDVLHHLVAEKVIYTVNLILGEE